MQATKKINLGTKKGTEFKTDLNDETKKVSLLNKIQNVFKAIARKESTNEEVKMESKEIKNFNRKVSARREEFNTTARMMMFTR